MGGVERIQAKVDQAIACLKEFNVDAWITFVRESDSTGEPVIPLILGHNLTWPSALILTRAGERIAILGKGDHQAAESIGAWHTVIPYVEGIRAPLRDVLAKIKPERVALNISRDDALADGLTYGMYQMLQYCLEGTPWLDNVVPAQPIISALRTRKRPEELVFLREAVAVTESIFDEVGEFARSGMTEREIGEFMHRHAREMGLETSWDAQMCPTVNTGPHSMFGHGIPSDIVLEPGHILHIDFGLKVEGYCADLQRCWYVPRGRSVAPPLEVTEAFRAVVEGIEAAVNGARPGVTGHEVDELARSVVKNAGYPQYEHATGHHVGLSTHDGGGLLGPLWDRYGDLPNQRLEAGNVLTVEPSIRDVDGRGGIGVEEMIVITETGAEYLSQPQRELPVLHS